MAADSERLLHARCRPYPWVSVLEVLYVCMAILTVAVGGMALVAASPLRQIIESLVNIHLLFAVLLCTLLITRYRWLVEHPSQLTCAAINELSRQSSRIVYTILYSAMGLREINGLIGTIFHVGAADFRFFDEHFHGAPQAVLFNLRDDCQTFLATGLLALISIRALAFVLWRRSHFRSAAEEDASNILTRSH
jgi:cytochrome b561